MSILGQATAAQGGVSANLVLAIVLAALGLVAVWVAARAGVFRRGSITGPPRIAEREPLGMLVLVLGMAVMLLIMTQVLCVTAQTQGKTIGATTATTSSATTKATTVRVVTTQIVAPLEAPVAPAEGMTPGQLALASSVPPLIAFAFMVIANRTIRVNGLVELGLTKERLARGVIAGLVGSLIAVPLVFLASMVTEFVWQSLHYSHPGEHELLKVLGESGSPLLGVVLVMSAVAVAPLFEEMLFRGHLQTLLTYAWVRLGRRPVVSVETPVIPLEAGFAAPPVAEVPRSEPAVWMRWASVILTATLFSLVHPLWMRPPILVLAVCLGYAYERTGNLWTTITMHAVFNGVNTVLFMTLMR
jgi:membrane protease YdiL (CAAX protease family)